MILNIVQEKEMVGVFHFSTVNLAAGNIIVLEDSIDNSNNIVLSYNDYITVNE